MSNVEIVGIVVIGLSALLVLIAQLINITSKLTQPFKELTEAIHALKIVVERLMAGQERIDNELQYNVKVEIKDISGNWIDENQQKDDGIENDK